MAERVDEHGQRDGRHFIADSRKIVDRSVSCFADRSPARYGKVMQ